MDKPKKMKLSVPVATLSKSLSVARRNINQDLKKAHRYQSWYSGNLKSEKPCAEKLSVIKYSFQNKKPTMINAKSGNETLFS